VPADDAARVAVAEPAEEVHRGAKHAADHGCTRAATSAAMADTVQIVIQIKKNQLQYVMVFPFAASVIKNPGRR